ncbi:MAG: type II toxin-antitoxin system Phd/YefM family antitoxin [Armatimonadota bacterium]
MAITVGAYEAKTHLPQLLERVARGEHVVITRHGVPIAEISPVKMATTEERREAIEKLKRFSVGKRADGTIRAMIEEGRM